MVVYESAQGGLATSSIVTHSSKKFRNKMHAELGKQKKNGCASNREFSHAYSAQEHLITPAAQYHLILLVHVLVNAEDAQADQTDAESRSNDSADNGTHVGATFF